MRVAAPNSNRQWAGPWKIERAVEGLVEGEGPAWSRDGYLLFSDTAEQKIHKYVPGGAHTVYRENSNGANGNAFDSQGRLWTCEYLSRRVTRTSTDGKIETVAEAWRGKRFNAPNDIVVRQDGHSYFSDPLFTPLENRELDFYGVYHITPSGALDLVAQPVGRPNGVALSPDGTILYVANSDENNVRAYYLDDNGRPSGERVVISGVPPVVDGLKTDSLGNLFLASEGIQIYSSSGVKLGHIPIPGPARNCAWGDGDRMSLYITGPRTLFRVRMPVEGWSL